MEITYWLVVLGVMFLYLQLILGRICRWSNNWFIQKGAHAAYKLPNLINTIILGSMPKEHGTVVWVLYLAALNNSLVSYHRGNILQNIWSLFNAGLFVEHANVAVSHAGLKGVAGIVAKSFIAALVFTSTNLKLLIEYTNASRRDTEEVAEYMRTEHVGPTPAYHNASNLIGYRYLVCSTTTVEEIYKRGYDMEASAAGEVGRREDLCLSFALFRLLFRRYHGLPCAEAELRKTRDLVVEGLLPQQADDGGQTRGFGVVEVELAFLHDHIHGGYVLWSREHRNCYLVLALLKGLIFFIGASVIYVTARKEQSIHLPNPTALLLLHGVLDLLQIIVYYKSDRWMVSYMCRRVGAGKQNGFHRFIARMHRYKFCWDDYWQNRIGQYSLLELQQGESSRTTVASLAVSIFKTVFPQQTSIISHNKARESAPVVFPPHLKTRIAQVLRSSNGLLDGVLSLERANYLPQGESVADKVRIILRWHIATCYCDIARLILERPVAQGACYKVAITLSRYCAYLVAFRPELLPGLESNTKFTFREVLLEVTALLGETTKPATMVFNLLEHRRMQGKGQNVTLSDGLNLGWHLVNNFTDEEQRWQVIENIWLKLLLSVVPQEAEEAFLAERHTNCLSQGGEFVTHLWAMLSHGGILKQQPWPMA